MENFIFCTVRYVKGSKIIRDFETLVMYAQQRNNRVKSNIFYTNIPKNELKFQIRNFHIDNVSFLEDNINFGVPVTISSA